MKTTPGLFYALLLLLAFGACKKSSSDLPPNQPAGNVLDSLNSILDTASAGMQVSYPKNALTGCFPSPLYGDSVIYPQPTSGSDYVVSPVIDPGAGHYLAWPAGLVIDSLSGAIDITKSQTGQRYAIGYVKNGSKDTCLSTIIIGGADYADSIYVLANGESVAVPIFNANVNMVSVCDRSGGSNHCSFDLTNSAGSKNLVIDDKTGEIDLAKSLNGTNNKPGLFGSNPQNGAIVSATIVYSIKTGSNNAVQSMDVDLVYYDSKSNVNATLSATIQERLNNILLGNLISFNVNPRPPLIVIVRRLY